MRNYTFTEVTGKNRALKEDVHDNVYISFGELKNNKFTLHIYIGENISRKLGFKERDKLKFYIADENVLVFKILKSKMGIISLSKEKTFGLLHTQTIWHKRPPPEDRSRRPVKYEIIKDGLLIDGNPQNLEMHL